MSVKYLVYLLIAMAVLVAGCAMIPGMMPKEKRTAGEAALPVPVPATAPTPPGPAAAGVVTVTKPFDLNAAQWMEYRSGTSGGPAAEVRLEYDENPLTGGRMVSLKRTQTSNNAASMSTNNGGTMYSFSQSDTQSRVTSNMISLEKIKADDPILYADEITGDPGGSEIITVPKGDYDCQKYVTSFKGSYAEYWEASGVPVPVKIYTACDGTTLELVDWG